MYKYSDDNNRRLFGGMNVALFGDLWQLPPVSKVSILANPFRKYDSFHVTDTLRMFWFPDKQTGFSEKALTEFQVCKRIDDPWYSNVMNQCRDGALEDDSYNFLHGYPTLTEGCHMENDECTECKAKLDKKLADTKQELRESWMASSAEDKVILTLNEAPS